MQVSDCLVAHPSIQDIIATGFFGNAAEAVIRVGSRTGDRLVLGEPSAEGFVLPEGVKVIGRNEARKGKKAFITEEVAGINWRISAQSFFPELSGGS